MSIGTMLYSSKGTTFLTLYLQPQTVLLVMVINLESTPYREVKAIKLIQPTMYETLIQYYVAPYEVREYSISSNWIKNFRAGSNLETI